MKKATIDKYGSKCFKFTPQRLAILDFLDGNTSHPTAETIYREMRKKYPRMSFATVYNTMEALKRRGEIMEITINPERKHYDPNASPHHHVICTACGKIGDVFVDFSPFLSLPSEVTDEFSVTGSHVNFYGVCAECGQNNQEDKVTHAPA